MGQVFGAVFPLVILGAIVALIVFIVRRRRGDALRSDPGIGTLRRLYFYGVSFVALMMAANGVVQIARYVLDAVADEGVVSTSRTPLAIGLSLLIVGLPLWLLHWMTVQRQVKRLPVETESVVRKVYLVAVMGVSVALAVATAINLLQWVLRVDEFDGYSLASLIVWSAVWVFHWRVDSEEGYGSNETQAVHRIYLYIVSLSALSLLAVGLGQAVHIVLQEGYDALVSSPVVRFGGDGLWRDSIRTSLAVAVVGAVLWAGHWLRLAARDASSGARMLAAMVFPVIGGAVTVLVAAILIVNGVLQWLLGATSDEASAHFSFLSGAMASLAVGAVIWAYHWRVVQREGPDSEYGITGLERAHSYALAALGLGAVVVSISMLVFASFTTFVETGRELLASEDVWREPMAAGLSVGLLGLPLWAYLWVSAQRRAETLGAAERALLPRRIFVGVILGVGMLAVLSSVSAVIFVFLRDVLGVGLDKDTVRDSSVALGALAAAVVFLPYYWTVYKKDRLSEPPPKATPAEGKEVMVMITVDDETFVDGLEDALGRGVDILRRADSASAPAAMTAEAYEELVQRIGAAEGRNVLVVADGEAVAVLSYR
ncbi:MAG: DUF5671 domain-containing protein [Chloroflexi bacterium]|nr:DUF5671 domain-containing protein [Chloroflexota bacterium]